MQLKPEDVVNFIYLAYNTLKQAIESILWATIGEAHPELVLKFSDAITWLISITALWLIFEFFAGFRRIIRILVVLGWALLIISIAIGLSV